VKRRAIAVTILALAVKETYLEHAPLGLMVGFRGLVGVVISLVYCSVNGLPLYNAKHQVRHANQDQDVRWGCWHRDRCESGPGGLTREMERPLQTRPLNQMS
jgi:hypothetical protein